jgi:NDP-sugar pyrophosphorylase family protein
MGINSSRNMFSLCSANYGIEKLIVMEKQGEKNMESKKSESDNQKIHIFLAPGAHVVGDVTLGENVGIWYNAVVRGDTGSIFIDDNSNVQDNSTLHTDAGHSVHIGKGVSVGHNAVVHGCTIGDNTVVGMGSKRRCCGKELHHWSWCTCHRENGNSGQFCRSRKPGESDPPGDRG